MQKSFQSDYRVLSANEFDCVWANRHALPLADFIAVQREKVRRSAALLPLNGGTVEEPGEQKDIAARMNAYESEKGVVVLRRQVVLPWCGVGSPQKH